MIQPRMQSTVAIVGLGNLLLKDDGVGIHALQALEGNPPAHATLIDGGTAVLHTADLLEGIDQVVAIDALLGGGTPGTVYLMDGMQANMNTSRLSIHSCGLREALQFMPSEQRPREILVVGVEPEHVTYHTELSTAVAAALPQVLDTVHAVIEGWTLGRPTEHLIRERMCT